jgi:lipid-A-disaccharide synthase-like uncharacterized protein
MLELIAFCILLFCGAVAASGTAGLVMILISPGELLESWQRVLIKIEPERGSKCYALRLFWYKRLGGCSLCLKQFIAELSFVAVCIIYSSLGDFPTAFIEPAWLRWLLNVTVFIGYSGLCMQTDRWLSTKCNVAEQQEEKIIETRYRNN